MLILDIIPEDWGHKFESNGIAVTNSQVGPTSIHITTKAYFFLVMLSPQPERSIAINSDRPTIGLAPAGCLEIVPQNSELFSQWRHNKHSLLIAITKQRLINLIKFEQEDKLGEFHLPRLGVVDQTALALASDIRNELIFRQIGYDECLESLLTLFGIHMIRTYTSLKKKRTNNMKIIGGLAPIVRKRITDYIYAHLSEKLTIEKLASVAGLSPSYFTVAFRQSFGQSPHEFIVSTRLQTARNMILTSTSSLGEISKITGFSSNSHMTALMKKTWGNSPRQIRYSGSETLFSDEKSLVSLHRCVKNKDQ